MFSEVLSVIWQAVIGLLLRLDGIVYDLICYFYEIFLFLAELDIFENADYYNIVKRIYIILGVIMLFVLTYSLLRAVINPDNFSKGENSFGNIIKNVVMSLVIIALLPTTFEVANRVQNVILNSDFIGKLILTENFTTGVVADGGRKMSSTVFQAFLRIDDNIGNADIEQDANLVTAALQDAFNKVEQGQSFKLFAMDFDYNGETIFFPELIAKNAVSYTMIVSTLAGAFLLWAILLFCFDLAIRVIKLIYYQLIAPVAVICRVLPGKKTKPIFDNWLKYTLSTYAEVFVRILIMYLGIYLITLIRDRMGNIFSAASESGLGGLQQALVVAFLIMGVVAFIRQAPKLIQNVFGIESGGLNLGFKGLFERAGTGGALATAGLVGGSLAGMGRNWANARANGRGVFGSAISSLRGGVLAGSKSFMHNMGSKNMKDLRENTNKGISEMREKEKINDYYRSRYKGKGGVIGGKISEGVKGVEAFLGIGGNLDALQKEKSAAEKLQGFYNTMKGYVQDDEAVANYEGMYQSELKREINRTEFNASAYQTALNNSVASMRREPQYASLDTNELYKIASSRVNKSDFERTLSESEYQRKVTEREKSLKMYSNLKKMAEVKAVNDKLNDLDENGLIKDGRFRAATEGIKTFKAENAQYDFVKNAEDISGIEWKDEWNNVMLSGNGDAIDKLFKDMKTKGHVDSVAFLADSEVGKNRAGSIGADIAKLRENNKTSKDNK